MDQSENAERPTEPAADHATQAASAQNGAPATSDTAEAGAIVPPVEPAAAQPAPEPESPAVPAESEPAAESASAPAPDAAAGSETVSESAPGTDAEAAAPPQADHALPAAAPVPGEPRSDADASSETARIAQNEPQSEPAGEAATAAGEAAPAAGEAPTEAEPVGEATAAAEPAAVHTTAPAAETTGGAEPAAGAQTTAGDEAGAPGAEAGATPAGETAGETPQRPAQPDKAAKADERRLRAQQAWERVVNAKETNESLTGVVTAAVKGGLLVDVGGIRGFLPASQVRPPQGTSIEALVKAKMPLRVIDIDQSRRRIVVSHRRALEDERRAKRRELLSSLQVGQVREGTVVRLTDFGAFVDLGGVDGLIPMRELAFERVETAADVVRIGEQLRVEVLRIDDNGKKISLSRRNALNDPWRDHANVLRQGTTVEGKVVAKEPRLQVEIAPGIVGTIRESDANPADYEIGEAVEVAVRFVDRRTRRITLTTMHGAAAAPAQPTSSGFAPLGIELGRRT